MPKIDHWETQEMLVALLVEEARRIALKRSGMRANSAVVKKITCLGVCGNELREKGLPLFQTYQMIRMMKITRVNPNERIS
jgi:hypothetical protein